MTQPLSAYTQARWRNDEPDGTPPPPPTNRRPPDPPEPPELPDFDTEVYARAARSMGQSPTVENPALEALSALHHARDAVMQQRLDAFRAQTTPTYHTPLGDVRVATPFWMPHYPMTQKASDELEAVRVRLGMSQAEITLLHKGHGTPEQVQRVTQALLDMVGLPLDGSVSTDDRVRRLMVDHGIGMECAGYVAQAFLASRGVDRAHSPLAPVSASSEQLYNLQYRGFVRSALDAARPGDIVALGAPQGELYGHCVIVYAARDATEADRQFLRSRAERDWRDAQELETNYPESYAQREKSYQAVMQVAASADLRVLVVDSAWGSDKHAEWGGVERRMWWHDTLGGPWVWTNRGGVPYASATPYDHPVEGVYRPQGEP